MTASEVLEETDTFMKRSVTFKDGMGPPGGKAIEELQLRKPWKVNIISGCDFDAYVLINHE